MKLRTSTVSVIAATTLLLTQSVGIVQAQEEDLAIANQVVINATNRHEHVAEKYAEISIGENAIVKSTTNSATLLEIKLDPQAEQGELVSEDEIDESCDQFQDYLRELRRENAKARRSGDTPQIVYSFKCEPNAVMHAEATTPNDPRFSELWGLNNPYNDVDVDAPEAWDVTTGSNQTVVAIIDSGIDYTHPDLVDNMWKNPAEVNGLANVDDDNNGVVDDIFGFNAIWNNPSPKNPMDDNNHGTHCAGTIGGVGHNDTGVTGVNWNVKLMAVKFLGANGSGSLYDAARAVDYVTNTKLAGSANVVASNNSWGGGGFYNTLYDAIQRSSNAGVLFIAAAGNNGKNIDTEPSYPASYDVPNVISVGAIDASGFMAYFSNFGRNNVDVVAPGVNILSSVRSNGYSYFNGTSMATPHVSGLIGLLSAYAPRLTMVQKRDILFNSTKFIASASGITKFEGIPSAIKMLREADKLGLGGVPLPPTAVPTPRPTATAVPTPTPSPTPTPTPTIAPGNWHVGGVAQLGGVGFANAKVVLQINGLTLTTYTNKNGGFSIPNVAGPGNYTLTIIAGGYTFTSTSGMLSGNVSVTLTGQAKNYKLRASVIDEQGRPVSGATIEDSSLGRRTSDSNGMVEFAAPYGSEYSLFASKGSDEFLDSVLTGNIRGDTTRYFVIVP